MPHKQWVDYNFFGLQDSPDLLQRFCNQFLLFVILISGKSNWIVDRGDRKLSVNIYPRQVLSLPGNMIYWEEEYIIEAGKISRLIGFHLFALLSGKDRFLNDLHRFAFQDKPFALRERRLPNIFRAFQCFLRFAG